MANLSPRLNSLRKTLWQPYALLLLLILVVMTIQQAIRHDLRTGTHLSAGHTLVSGQDLYPPGTPYVYPPFTSFLMVPFAYVPLHVAQVLWFMISAVALAVIIRSAWVLSGGGRLDRWDAAGRWEHVILWLGCLCALRFLFNALQHLSLDLLSVMLLMVGGAAVVGGRFTRAAICWGLAAAFKGPPLLFAVYLLWRRKWWSAGLMVLLAISVNLLPDLIHRPREGGVWLTRWYHQIIQPMGSANYTPGAWNADILDNQSISGAANRWFLTTYAPSADGIAVTDRADPVSRPTLKYIVYGVEALLCLIVGLLMPPGSFSPTSPGDPEPPRRATLEFGVVMLLMLLLSPMSSRSLFSMMLLPAFCVARAAIVGRDRVAAVCLALAILASLISFNAPFARTFNREMLWLGIVTMSALALLVGCLWLLQRHRSTLWRSRLATPS